MDHFLRVALRELLCEKPGVRTEHLYVGGVGLSVS